MSENYQDLVLKSQRNSTFMNSAPAQVFQEQWYNIFNNFFSPEKNQYIIQACCMTAVELIELLSSLCSPV
jgi:hypothetical protein